MKRRNFTRSRLALLCITLLFMVGAACLLLPIPAQVDAASVSLDPWPTPCGWPFPWWLFGNCPTPTPQGQPVPTATVSVTPVASATPLTPTVEATLTVTATPVSTLTTPALTPTATAPGGQGQTLASGVYTLDATTIVATNAHLQLLPAPFNPVLTFATVSMQGMQLSRPIPGNATLTISADGTVTGMGIAIKTSVFHDLVTALSSFTDKADLLILVAGGTVPTLTMHNVHLLVDGYISSQTIQLPGMHLNIT